MPIQLPASPETWHAWWVVGVLFPAHVIIGVASVPLLLFFLARLSPWAWAFAVLYAPFYLYPAQLKYPGWKGADWLWNLFDYQTTCPSYFGQFGVHGGERVDRAQQYFVACHPHGCVIFQRTFWRSASLERLFDRPWRMLAASALFRIPLVRELTLLFGAVDAGRANCERLLRAGANVVVWPGGLDEANTSDDLHSPQVTLRTRSGFVRLAVRHGAAVLPVFVFGELDAVSAVPMLPRPLAAWLQRTLRISSNIFLGRYRTFIPKRVPFNLCLGKPIAVDAEAAAAGEAALEAEVKRVHAAYKEELRRLYEENKERFGYESRALVFACDAQPKSVARSPRTKKVE